ncbi:MAG: hypothetical protein ACR2JO_08145 [Mycobacteriales bacterium]
MLASITPLGERGRHRRWGPTVAAYVVGSLVGGALLGTLLGAIGQLLPHRHPLPLLAAFAVACVLGLVLDARVGGLALPSVSRQVDESWLGRYRGWVYGLGFGFQLGLGVVTIVTTSSVYLTFMLALLGGSAVIGGLLGAVFGGVRSLPLVAMRAVAGPAQLRAVHRRLRSWEPWAAHGTTGAVAACAVAATVAGWPT